MERFQNKLTFKNLLAIDEKGLGIFCSNTFDGSASDQQIIKESGFYDLLNVGDSFWARKGVGLNIPPFKG